MNRDVTAALADVASDAGSVETVDDAREVGRSVADELRTSYDETDPVRLATTLDVPIARDYWAGLEEVQLLGSYRDGEITVYPRQIAARADEIGVDHARLETAVVAHELGHHVLSEAGFGDDRSTGLLNEVLDSIAGTGRSDRTLEERAAEQFTIALTGTRLPDDPVRKAVSAHTNRTVASHDHDD